MHQFKVFKKSIMNIVEAVKSEVNKVSPANEVILFGSRARGDHRADSDWDFLILLNSKSIDNQLKEEIYNCLYELELATDSVISSIVHTKEDWEKRALTLLYKNVKKEGIYA